MHMLLFSKNMPYERMRLKWYAVCSIIKAFPLLAHTATCAASLYVMLPRFPTKGTKIWFLKNCLIQGATEADNIAKNL